MQRNSNFQTFDLVFQSTVFSSVLDTSMKRQMADEMCRVLKPDGLILWYDYHMNNPRNPDVKGVKHREIYALFPDCDIRLQKITRAANRTPAGAAVLASVLFLKQDSLALQPLYRRDQQESILSSSMSIARLQTHKAASNKSSPGTPD